MSILAFIDLDKRFRVGNSSLSDSVCVVVVSVDIGDCGEDCPCGSGIRGVSANWSSEDEPLRLSACDGPAVGFDLDTFMWYQQKQVGEGVMQQPETHPRRHKV